jgi:GT2 family glycosyltransferase
VATAPAAAEPARAPKLSVIVVTWNVRELTLACLAAVYRTTAGLPIEVIVVDNGSEDGTTAAVRARFPEARVIANAVNAGFPRANNQGLAAARGEHVLFLNPDTEVGEGAIGACVAELDRDATVGATGCKLLYSDGRIQLECARRPYLLRHLLAETLYLHMLFPTSAVFAHHVMGDWDHEGSRDVEALCGAFLMVRRELAHALGGLPEDLFMYHEDLSFCLRVRRAGWRIRYLGEWSTVHHWRQSSRKSTAALALLEGACKLQLIREAQGSLHAAVGRGVFAVRSLLRLVVAGAGTVLPATSRVRERYPRVFDARRHALQLAWALAPWTVRRLMPRNAERAPVLAARAG